MHLTRNRHDLHGSELRKPHLSCISLTSISSKHHRRAERFFSKGWMDSVTGEDRTRTYWSMALDHYPSKHVNETSLMKLEGSSDRFLQPPEWELEVSEKA